MNQGWRKFFNIWTAKLKKQEKRKQILQCHKARRLFSVLIILIEIWGLLKFLDKTFGDTGNKTIYSSLEKKNIFWLFWIDSFIHHIFLVTLGSSYLNTLSLKSLNHYSKFFSNLSSNHCSSLFSVVQTKTVR